jgi:phage tail tape-measure protein
MYTNHAYSIISAFTMTNTKYAEKMIMMRSLHGETLYDGKWKASDPAWTDELAAQVPLGIDPRKSEP